MKAIVIGHTGQDGTYLTSLLVEKGYQVIGVSSKTTKSYNCEYNKLVNIKNIAEVDDLIVDFKPNEIYFLAAVHQSSSDKQVDEAFLFQESFEINCISLINFLQSIKNNLPEAKLFYAASSHIFGNTPEDMQNELTPFNPNCIYGITKTAGVNACHFYKNNFNLFTSVGIFYNHESPLRESKYVSKKIIESVVAIHKKNQEELIIGNLEAKIDWGFAPDYVRAVYQILQLKEPNDFIISSGEQHTVGEFVNIAFEYLNLDWKKYVKINSSLITKNQKKNLFGDNSKIKKHIDWNSSFTFNQMIYHLIDSELAK